MDLWDLWAGVEWLRVGVDDVGTWLPMAARCKTLRTSSRCAYQTRRRAAGADVIESCPSAFVLPRLDLALDPTFPVFIPCLLESTSTS